jgi:cytochrome c556
MNATTLTKTVITTTAVAAILIGATAVSAEAKTDTIDGSKTAAYQGRIYQIDELVAMEKERMARDYVKYAAARARLAASQIGPPPGEPRPSNRWGVGGSEL